MTKRDFAPIHPGAILLAEFLEPMGITQYRLAKDIGVTPRRINEIVHGRRAVTADTALRLGRFFNMEAQFWLNLQNHYDMEVALEALQGRLETEVRPSPAQPNRLRTDFLCEQCLTDPCFLKEQTILTVRGRH